MSESQDLEITPILVVDDEPLVRRVLIGHLERDDYVCYEASSGNEALALLQQIAVPLVISDLQMPDGDGRALLRAVRERHPETAVVILTGAGDVETAVACLQDGATDFITKPFVASEVEVRIERALESRRLRLEVEDYRRHLEQRVTEQAQRIQELFLNGVQALVAALEIKDAYTRGHSERVAQWAQATAQFLGLDDDLTRQVELGGHLHDLGKIGVRATVLTKDGRLTDEEYDHVMQHMVLGWRILSPLLRDAPHALAAVRHHHERWDGRGRPDGLIADAIPLPARIVAVADAYDVLTTGRPYKNGGRVLSSSDALAELEASSNQFDLNVVRAFRRVVEGKGGRISRPIAQLS